MSKTTSESPFRHSKAKAVAFASAAVLGTLGTVALPHLDPGDPKWSTFDGCSITGDPSASPEHKAENALKNRYVLPSDESFDGNADLNSLRDPKLQSKFSEDKSAEITGYITDVKMGGVESCNCKTNEPKDMDTHIYVGPAKDSPKKDCVIVEVTPRVRAEMALIGRDWSTETLKAGLWGKKVQIMGWLFYDGEHENASVTSKSGKYHPKKPWRATCWEIHPVTDISILPQN